MVCKITFIRCRRPALAGATLVENLVGMALGGIVIGAVCAFSLFNARGFAGLSSYTAFDLANRKAIDQMTKDFRMIQAVTNITANSIRMADYDGTPMRYSYDPTAQTLTRVRGTNRTVLLQNCSRLSYIMNMRNMSNGTFDFYPTTNVLECKAITINWCCSRQVLGNTSDDMPQSETVVIRN